MLISSVAFCKVPCAIWPTHLRRLQKHDSFRKMTADSGLRRKLHFINSCNFASLKECHNIIIREKKRSRKAEADRKAVSPSHKRIPPISALNAKRNVSTPFNCLPQSTNCQTHLLGRIAVNSLGY